MKRSHFLSVLVLAVCMSGCVSTGLSVREQGVYNYSNFVYGLYDKEPLLKDNEGKMMPGSLTLAVAQIGETAPPQIMLDRLKEEQGMIAKVIPLPAGPCQLNNTNDPLEQENVQDMISRMRYLSKDLGADHLFLIGGSADYRVAGNFFQMFDITIVGAFILPSYKHTAEGRASGVLIDVDTGQVQLIVNSEGKATTYTPSYLDYYSTANDGQGTVVTRLRDDLVTKLSDAFIEELKAVRQGA